MNCANLMYLQGTKTTLTSDFCFQKTTFYGMRGNSNGYCLYLHNKNAIGEIRQCHFTNSSSTSGSAVSLDLKACVYIDTCFSQIKSSSNMAFIIIPDDTLTLTNIVFHSLIGSGQNAYFSNNGKQTFTSINHTLNSVPNHGAGGRMSCKNGSTFKFFFVSKCSGKHLICPQRDLGLGAFSKVCVHDNYYSNLLFGSFDVEDYPGIIVTISDSIFYRNYRNNVLTHRFSACIVDGCQFDCAESFVTMSSDGSILNNQQHHVLDLAPEASLDAARIACTIPTFVFTRGSPYLHHQIHNLVCLLFE